MFFKPAYCYYYVTLRCNSKCEFCDIWQKKEHYQLREQTLEEVEANLRDVKKLGVTILDFTGGEPFLYPHLTEALRLAKKYKFYTSVTTNCILYPKYAEKIKGLTDILNFSFDSVDEHEHNKIRGVRCFDKVMESIEISKRLKQKMYLFHNVTNETCKDVDKIVDFAQRNRCTLKLSTCFDYFGNEAVSNKVASAVEEFAHEPYVIVDHAQLELIRRGGNSIKKPLCRAISSTVIISPDNYLLLPCYHHYCEKIKINNNLYEVYNSDKVKKLKKQEGTFSFCDKCTIGCYFKNSLYRNFFTKYQYLFLLSVYKTFRERIRPQF